ncbi:hypothetical protein D3C84_1295050 [compost metagenome]
MDACGSSGELPEDLRAIQEHVLTHLRQLNLNRQRRQFSGDTSDIYCYSGPVACLDGFCNTY